MARRVRVAAALLAGLLIGASLLSVVTRSGHDAVIGQVRATADYQMTPNTNNAPSRGKAGPNLAVNPAHPNHVVSLVLDLETEECEYNSSLDGGTTWSGGGELNAPAGYPTNLPGPCDVTGHGAGSIGQRSLEFGSGNNVYAVWTAAKSIGSTGFSVLLSKSTDGGATFPTAIEIPGMVGGVAPAPDFFRPEITVDRRTVTTDRLFIASRDSRTGQAVVIRSDDAGATWTAPVAASNADAAPVWSGDNTVITTAGDAFTRTIELTQPVLGPSNKIDGIRPLYVGWVAPKNSGTCPPSCEQVGENSTDSYIVVAKSLDSGATWTRNRAVNVRGFTSPAGTLYGGSHFPRLAAGLGGEVYMTFNQGPGVPASDNCGSGPFPILGADSRGVVTCPSYAGGFKQADHFMNWDIDVWFVRSANEGATWGNLRQLNEPKTSGLAVAEITQTRHPEMNIAPDGRIDIAWEDRRHWYLNTSDRKGAVTPAGAALDNYACVQSHSNCPEARLGDTYYSYSTDGGVGFSFNRRLNDISHNNDVGQDYRFSAYWDYGPAIAALGNERLLVADMDARFGNVDNDSLDIVLRKVDLNHSGGAVPTASIGSGGAPSLSVALSQRQQQGGGEAVHGEGFTSRPWTRPVIVNESDMPSALVGGVLARANVGPLLATPAAALPAAVQAEVGRLGPVGAYIIGDTTKVSAAVEANLVTAGVPAAQIVRITGASSADIAATVATTLDRRRAIDRAPATTVPLPAYDAVIIANPNSASASSASALASNRRLPILYVDQDAVPAVTAAAIATLNVNRAIIVGSTGVISAGVASALSPGIPAANITRLSGTDQFGTSKAVVTESVARGLPRNVVYTADGNEPMHAALLGAAVGRMGGLLLLTPGGAAASAETTLSAAPFNLRPFIDRIVTSDLTGTAHVANDPAVAVPAQ